MGDAKTVLKSTVYQPVSTAVKGYMTRTGSNSISGY